jgi:hypothetical protein
VVEQATNDCVIKSSYPAPPSTPDESIKKKILIFFIKKSQNLIFLKARLHHGKTCSKLVHFKEQKNILHFKNTLT